MSGIELRHVFKDYNPGEHAVTDFNLEIQDGEFLVLVGPSGCGKSTTLRMIAGLEEITSGKLFINGEDVSENHPKDRDIAMVFQSYALYPHMTVEENMAFGLKMKKMNKEETRRRVVEAAEVIDMEDYLEALPKELSGGQRQRVALGRAIVRDPNVFLMDEPLSNLDAKLRVHTRAELSTLHQRLGTTTIYVTHDQVEAMTMADRIVVMDKGKIQQVGTPREIYLNPRNLFVAGFIGAPAMNFVNVKIKEEGILVGDRTIDLPDFVNDQLIDHGYLDKTIVLGLRPEHIYLSQDASPKLQESAFNIKIKVAEMLGNETLIHFDLAGENFIAKIITLDEFTPDETIKIAVDHSRIHFFDPDQEGLLIPIEQENKNLVHSNEVN